jgi:type IV pilus assembly protein PilY1
VCSPGGYGWVNYLNYTSGSLVAGNTIAGERFNAPPVGSSTVYVKGEGSNTYTPVIIVGTADADLVKAKVSPPLGAGKFQKRRLIWRELIPQ